MEKYFKLLLGALLIVGGVYTVLYWMGDVLALIKGSFGIFIFLIGLLIILIGVSDLS